MQSNQSEVARLMQQITLEYEAAGRGLNGLAQGTALHTFINAKQERIGACHEALQQIVGKAEAIKLVVTAMNQVQPEGTTPQPEEKVQ
ncbi:MAG: hypothetical protein ABI406_04970 [Ktedonobacteraceae bacterium]